MIGKTIAHYEILEKIGAGGMGEVYRVHDTKLDRDVALKILPEDLALDPERRMRFEREAKAVAALKHPNIVTIHSVEEVDSIPFITMELVDGKTLVELIPKDGLALDRFFDLAIPLTDAVASAHAHGVTHRDLKPANVMMDADGRLKVLDFGLARLRREAAEGSQASTELLTQEGFILGTVPYMSPEQLKGGAVDHRSDIFSMGTILYELATGERPFQGDTNVSTANSIIQDTPPYVTELKKSLPRHLGRILNHCLEKDPEKRFQTMKDLRNELEELKVEVDSGELDPVQAHALPRRVSRRWLLPLVGALVLTALIVWKLIPFGTHELEAAEYAVAVVDFHDLSPTSDLAASAGLTELVNIGLVENSPIRVISPEYLHDLRRRSFGASRGPIEKDQALEIARQSKATLFLAGQVGGSEDGQFVTWRLVDTRSGSTIGARRAEGNKLTELADEIIAEAVGMIVSECGVKLPGTPTRVEQVTTASPEAYRHYVSAMAFFDEAHVVKAVEELEKAVTVDSTFALAYLELARVSWGPASNQLMRKKAEGYADTAWALRSKLGIKDRMRLEAIRYEFDGEAAREIETYREMLKRWPDDRQTLADLQENLFFHWDMQGVVDVTERALALYPDDPRLEPLYRMSLAMLGRVEEAIQRDHRDVEENPDDPAAWYGLSRRYVVLGYPDSAEAAVNMARALDPEFFGDRDLCEYAYFAGDLDRAISIREETLKRRDLSVAERVDMTYMSMFEISLGVLYLEAGRYEEVLQICEAAIRDTTSGVWFPERGVVQLLVSIGEAKKALALIDELVELDTRQATTHGLYMRGPALVALGDLEGAKRALKDLHERQEQLWKQVLGRGLTLEARISLAENDPDRALNALQRRRQMGVFYRGLSTIEHREAMVRAYRMAGRSDDALCELQDLLRMCRGHAPGYYELGQIYEEMGRSEDAKEAYAKFLEMWWRADEGLPQLIDARERLSALRGKTE
jgi:serine/threonine protein kinase/tetratricopeptide (TPR) repeat protein